jgi:hypothetical protein
VFGRRRSARDRDAATDASGEDLPAEAAGEEPAPPEKVSGPWDAADGFPAMERIDLGSLQVPVLHEIEIQLVFAEQQGALVTARYGDNAMQLQAFAAPKSGRLWDEIRAEHVTQITGAGGACEERQGPFGAELMASVPVQPGQPQAGAMPLRFVGVDGPRWFLQVVFAGQAALDAGASAPLEALLREVVVVRGDHPAPPRELLELRLPPDAQKALEEQARQQAEQQQQQEQGRFSTPPDPFERGPEFTETR